MKLGSLIKTRLFDEQRGPYLSNRTQQRFDDEKALILLSASIVTRRVLEMAPVRSVVDVGCGPGFWLKAFKDRGVEKITGIDGDYTNRSRLMIDPSCFIACDLNLPLGKLVLSMFDLATSLEVGEHLVPERAESLVDDLCALSDCVMYGAAIEHQRGEMHINEQPQSYWVEKFVQRDYLPYDVLRPAIWEDPSVIWWYKQNTILYVRRGSTAHSYFEKRFPAPSAPMFDLVHPELYREVFRLYSKPRGLPRIKKNVRRMVAQVTGATR